MYSVSEKFLTAIKSNVRRSKIRGTVNNTVVFTESNIEKDSLVINQSFLGSDLSLGNTQFDDLTVNIVGETSVAVGDEITVEWGLQIEAEPVQYEWIPLGIFVVDDVDKVGFISKISAFSRMIYFENDFESPDNQSRTPYQWLTYACQQCGVTLATDEAEVNALPNYGAYPVPADDKVRTYRNLLTYIGVISGCNYIINRSGELEIIPLVAKEPVFTIYEGQRVLNGLNLKEYEVSVSGVSLQSSSGEMCSSNLQTDGKILEFEEIPLLESENESNLTTIATNILNGIKYYHYQPFECEWQGNPALDISDFITFGSGLGITTVLAGRTFKFRNTEKIKAVGTLEASRIDTEASPLKNALAILQLRRHLQNYAPKAYVDAQIGEAIGDDY